jgi:hypothetical protein
MNGLDAYFQSSAVSLSGTGNSSHLPTNEKNTHTFNSPLTTFHINHGIDFAKEIVQ